MRPTTTVLFLLAALLTATGGGHAAEPRQTLNYQGVLRGADDRPKDGTFTMVFKLYEYDTAPDALLVDTHSDMYAGGVTVTRGLFNTQIGGGYVVDGPGPGTYTSLSEVFRDYGSVYLEITVNGEVLSPRTPIHAAAYAGNAHALDGVEGAGYSRTGHMHAGSEVSGPVSSSIDSDYLDGLHSWQFLDTSETAQTKYGRINLDSSMEFGSTGLTVRGSTWGVYGKALDAGGFFESTYGTSTCSVGMNAYGAYCRGTSAGGYFEDMDQFARAWVGTGDVGIDARGSGKGGVFLDLDGTGGANLGIGNRGIEASGSEAGGYFNDIDSSGYAMVAHGDLGILAKGSQGGALFADIDSSGYGYVGVGDIGVTGYGNETGAYFVELDTGANTLIASAGRGIAASGSEVGGYFRDTDGSGSANVGYGNTGIVATGSQAGAYFGDSDSSGYGYVGQGDIGVEGHGNTSGGSFVETDEGASADVAFAGQGISARGRNGGGYFRDTDGSGQAYVAYGNRGIYAFGSDAGGHFKDSDSTGVAWIGYDTYGLSAHGTSSGGFFQDDDGTGLAYVAQGDRGIWAKGTFAGGTFSHPDNVTFWADVSTPTHKIKGSGVVSFVQNDPGREDQVIVYAAPEGDEAAVYTRGKARLSGGEARIALGDTFRLVANPDVGLTAYVTPAGEWSDLYVASVSTEELVVRARPESPDVTFHYIVWGLRLGYEELAIVQPKEREAFLPTAEAIASSYGSRPELRAANALERHRAMSLAVGEGEPDLGRTRQLVAALEGQRARALAGAGVAGPAPPPAPPADAPTAQPERLDRLGPAAVVEPPTEQPRPAPTNLFPVSGEVEEGDVLALDPAVPGALRRCAGASDATVVGIAAAGPEEVGGIVIVAVADTAFALVKADAAPGAIAPGDLLVSSPLAGHAMRSSAPVPGTVLGKALEGLEAGTGTIRILVIPR